MFTPLTSKTSSSQGRTVTELKAVHLRKLARNASGAIKRFQYDNVKMGKAVIAKTLLALHTVHLEMSVWICGRMRRGYSFLTSYVS